MTDAFRAKIRINFVNLFALGDRIVGAFGFANITVNAFIGDH